MRDQVSLGGMVCVWMGEMRTNSAIACRAANLAIDAARSCNHSLGGDIVESAPNDDARQVSAEYELPH